MYAIGSKARLNFGKTIWCNIIQKPVTDWGEILINILVWSDI